MQETDRVVKETSESLQENDRMRYETATDLY